MIELNYGKIREGDFVMALGKLANYPNFGPKLAYSVAKIQRKVLNEAKGAQELFLKMVKKYAKLDEKGEIAPIPGPGQFTIRDEALEDWKKELEEFSTIKFQIAAHKLTFKDIEKVPLSPNDLIALEPVITELGAVEGGKGENEKEAKA